MLSVISFIGYLLLLSRTYNILKRNRSNVQVAANKRLTIGGSLAALAALLHAAPVFLPAIGLVLSPLSTLPVLLAALLLADQAFAVFLAAAALLFFINVKEAAIFFLATGPLGLSAALAAVSNKPLWRSLPLAASLLICGILLLVFSLGLPGLQNIVGAFNAANFLIIALFSLAYSSLFAAAASFLQKRLASLFAAVLTETDFNVDRPRHPRK
ncbi:MAG TPA: hypothetical protein GX528_09470 [Firmicutes bacterium]|nr:hypothetical protein [Bacillota bacterium]